MRAGLAREEERQQRKIQQQANKEELDAQKALHEHLIKSQSIKPTSGTATDSEWPAIIRQRNGAIAIIPQPTNVKNLLGLELQTHSH